jgi:hypothetical protein
MEKLIQHPLYKCLNTKKNIIILWKIIYTVYGHLCVY